MNRSQLLKLKEQALLQIEGIFQSTIAKNQVDAAHARISLACISMHDAVCRELTLELHTRKAEDVIALIERALGDLSLFITSQPETDCLVREAVVLLREAVRKGGAA